MLVFVSVTVSRVRSGYITVFVCELVLVVVFLRFFPVFAFRVFFFVFFPCFFFSCFFRFFFVFLFYFVFFCVTPVLRFFKFSVYLYTVRLKVDVRPW